MSARHRPTPAFRVRLPAWLARSGALALALAVLLPGATGRAGPNTWTGDGPPGGAAWRIEIDPGDSTHLYALGFRVGLFESHDSGQSWTKLAIDVTPFDRYRIVDFALDPNAPATIWVAAEWYRIVRSTDGGATWTSLSSGLPGTVGNVYAHPLTPGVAYATSYEELYKTTDNGDTWSRVGAATLALGSISSVLMHPTDPDTLYVLGWEGVFESVDGGASFVLLDNGAPAPASGLPNPRRGAIDPSSPDTIYVHFANDDIYRSTDGGASWAALGTNLPNDAYNEILVDPSDGLHLWLATNNNEIAQSFDGGSSWFLLPNVGIGSWQFSDLAIDPANPGRVLAASPDRGLFETLDSGASWSPINSGFVATTVESLAFDPTTSRLHAGTKGGVATSSDGGASWSWNVGSYDVWTWALAVDPDTPGRLLAGTHCCQLYESLDHGATWTFLPAGGVASPPYWIEDIVIPRSSPDTVFVAGPYRSPTRSLDGGQTWVSLEAGFAPFFAGSPSVDTLDVVGDQPLVVYAGSNDASDGGLFKSTDGGATWQRKTGAGTGAPELLSRVVKVKAHPSDPDVVFASGPYRTFRSDDGGDTWIEPTRDTPGVIGAVADYYVDDADPDLVYIAAANDNLFRSLDGGLSFEEALERPEEWQINAVTVDPDDPGTAIVGFDNVGIQRFTFSTDLGVDVALDAAQLDVGEELTVSVTIDNAGPVDASRVTVRLTLLPRFAFVSSTHACSEDAGTLTCEVPLLPDGSAEAVEIVLSAIAPGGADLAVEVGAREGLLDPAGATATAPITVFGGAAVPITPGASGLLAALLAALGWSRTSRRRRLPGGRTRAGGARGPRKTEGPR